MVAYLCHSRPTLLEEEITLKLSLSLLHFKCISRAQQQAITLYVKSWKFCVPVFVCSSPLTSFSPLLERLLEGFRNPYLASWGFGRKSSFNFFWLLMVSAFMQRVMACCCALEMHLKCNGDGDNFGILLCNFILQHPLLLQQPARRQCALDTSSWTQNIGSSLHPSSMLDDVMLQRLLLLLCSSQSTLSSSGFS